MLINVVQFWSNNAYDKRTLINWCTLIKPDQHHAWINIDADWSSSTLINTPMYDQHRSTFDYHWLTLINQKCLQWLDYSIDHGFSSKSTGKLAIFVSRLYISTGIRWDMTVWQAIIPKIWKSNVMSQNHIPDILLLLSVMEATPSFRLMTRTKFSGQCHTWP